jgi:hypothetical protein
MRQSMQHLRLRALLFCCKKLLAYKNNEPVDMIYGGIVPSNSSLKAMRKGKNDRSLYFCRVFAFVMGVNSL